MINSVPNLSFRGDVANAQDLINSPGQFASPAQIAELPPDSFEFEGQEKKKSGAKGILTTLALGLAAFAGLGYAVKKGHLEKPVINEADGFFKKLWPQTKNLAHTVGEYAVKAWDNTLGKLLTKKS